MALFSRRNVSTRKVVVTAGTTSDPVIVAHLAHPVTVVVDPNGGTATLYYTVSDAVEVERDPTTAIWVAWDEGGVTVVTGRSMTGPVTAVRLTAAAADATFEVAGAVK